MHGLKQVSGRVFIISGATANAGQRQARAHLAAGAFVVLADADAEAGRVLAYELGGCALYVAGDVGSEDGWWNVFRTTLDNFGRVDGVENDGSIHDPSASDGEDVIEYLATGCYLNQIFL